MTKEALLVELGYRLNTAKTYLAILELGDSGIADITENTGLHKQLVYTAAAELAEMKLISIETVNGNKQFSALPLKAFTQREEKRQRLVKQLVPRLEVLRAKVAPSEQTFTHKGEHAVAKYYVDQVSVMTPKSSICIVGMNSERYFALLNKEEQLFHNFEEIRIGKRITSRLLLFGTWTTETELNKNRQFIELRIGSSTLHSPNDIMIWEDSVGLLFYGEEPYVLDIRDKEAAEGFRNYFKALWAGGKQLI